jgi:cell division transport system permease protein
MALNTDYVLRETGTNLFRNLGLTVASIITVTIALVLVGVSFLIRSGLDQATAQWEGGIELIIFMEPDIQPAQRTAIETSLKGNPEVKRFEYVSKDEAYNDFKRLFKEQPEMIDAVQPDILPTSYKVVPVNPDIASIKAMRELYQNDAGVYRVVSADDTIRTMQSLFGFLSAMCIVVAFAGAIAAIVLIFNTIRMAMFARRREIEVMKLVGASNWFIRIPFMLEGLIQGLLGSLAAVGSIYLFNSLLGSRLEKRGIELLADFVVPTADLTVLSIVLVLSGVAVSMLFSLIAASMYLDV